MSKVSRKRLRELAMRDAVATPDEVRALVLEVKGARAMIERFEAALVIPRDASLLHAAVDRAALELGTATLVLHPSTAIN